MPELHCNGVRLHALVLGPGDDHPGPPVLMLHGLLVGNLAVRLGKRIEWDARKMRATNAPEADKYINKKYRKGWEI